MESAHFSDALSNTIALCSVIGNFNYIVMDKGLERERERVPSENPFDAVRRGNGNGSSRIERLTKNVSDGGSASSVSKPINRAHERFTRAPSVRRGN